MAPGEVEALRADSASVIVSFHGPRDGAVMTALHLRWYWQLSGNDLASTAPETWSSPDGRVVLRRWLPPSAAGHDAMVVQMALNSPGAVLDAWSAMREEVLRLTGPSQPHGLWGGTLVYQATLADDRDADQVFEAIAPGLQSLTPGDELSVLAQAEMGGGHICVVDVPWYGSTTWSTTYVAVCASASERSFVPTVLWGPAAMLFMPELIAHKGYSLRRQHLGQGERDDWYKQVAKRLRETTEDLLKDLGKRVAETDEVDDLARGYGDLAKLVAPLKQLRIQLLEQVHNFGRVVDLLGDNAVYAYHRQHLETAAYELDLKVEEGEQVLAAARDAGGLAQVSIDQEQGYRQYLIQIILALVSAAFAVTQLVDRELAALILERFGIDKPAGGFSLWALLAVQLACIVVCAPLFAVVVTWTARLFVGIQHRQKSRIGGKHGTGPRDT